jgi:hypothetical protein
VAYTIVAHAVDASDVLLAMLETQLLEDECIHHLCPNHTSPYNDYYGSVYNNVCALVKRQLSLHFRKKIIVALPSYLQQYHHAQNKSDSSKLLALSAQVLIGSVLPHN